MAFSVMTGNELLIQGGLEAGIDLYTGYPGSPLADFFNILYQDRKILENKGAHVVIGNSEANAAAMASGAKQAGRNTLIAMKSMGLHVASDALSVGNFANPGVRDSQGNMAGVVVAVGDDPWSLSTSTPADSRYLFKHLHLPFLEPSNPQELKDWIAVALKLSQESSLYTGILLTTFMAEGGGRVECGTEAKLLGEKVVLDPLQFDLAQNVMVPPNSYRADERMVGERFPKFQKLREKLSLDQRFGDSASRLSIVVSGAIFETVKELLENKNLLEQVQLIKIGCPYPVSNNLLDWLEGCEELVIVEEKRGFLEQEILALFNFNQKKVPKLYGKNFPLGDQQVEGFPAFGGLSYELLEKKFQQLFTFWQKQPFPCEEQQGARLTEVLPRLPTFCPGCPHRETLSVLKELRQDLEQQGIKLISHGDVGCYSLSFLQPFKEMHNISAMGQGGALGAGVDMFTDWKKNPSVALMGDSTFFHSGMTDISNSVQLGHNITYILLDNDNTAMTGHQMSPTTGQSVEGKSRPRQSIMGLVKSFGVREAIEIHPTDRYFYKNLLLDFVKKSGVKVVISNKECALTFGAKKRFQERTEIALNGKLKEKVYFQINTDACEDCRVCVEMTGCPGLGQEESAYGVKTLIDPSLCVSDSYCTQFKVCPSFEKIVVEDFVRPQSLRDTFKGVLDTPQAIKSLDEVALGQHWRAVVVGVGGSGVTTASKVLAKAACAMEGRSDLDFKFMDQKGLAQRNGRVTGHLVLHSINRSAAAVTPEGMGDLLLATDLLDGSQSLNFLSQQGLMVVDEDFQISMQMMLDHHGNSPVETQAHLKQEIQKLLQERALIVPAKKWCLRFLGNAVYASSFLVGVAFQAGSIPFSLTELTKAIQEGIKRKDEVLNNQAAFELGREYFNDSKQDHNQTVKLKNDEEHYLNLLKQSLHESFLPWHNKRALLSVYQNALERLCQYFPKVKKQYLGQYLHDLFVYNRGATCEDFILKAGELSIKIDDEKLQKKALRILARTYFVKDEIFISHQMISPIKKESDERKYKKLGKNYQIHPINKPVFPIGPWQLSFEFSPKPWMLKIMRHLRLLRFVLISWHKKEIAIQQAVRQRLMESLKNPSQLEDDLRQLSLVKGYREVYYKSAKEVFKHDF